MLSRPGALPTGSGWSFEPKYDGFRAVVSTENGLRVRSRRGWDMTDAVPEFQALPEGLVLDGELVAWKGREPYFPSLCRRMLNGDTSIRVSYVVFDLLGLDGTDLTQRPYEERRTRSKNSTSTGRTGTSPRHSTTGVLCTTPCAISVSRVWWRSGARADTGRTGAGGSRSRIRTTGAATWSARRCSGRASDVALRRTLSRRASGASRRQAGPRGSGAEFPRGGSGNRPGQPPNRIPKGRGKGTPKTDPAADRLFAVTEGFLFGM